MLRGSNMHSIMGKLLDKQVARDVHERTEGKNSQDDLFQLRSAHVYWAFLKKIKNNTIERKMQHYIDRSQLQTKEMYKFKDERV